MPESTDGTPLSGSETTSFLLLRAKGGDDRALELLCGRLIPRLRRWASGRLPASARSLVDTEDIVQEALVSSIRRLESFRPEGGGAFFAYVRRAITNGILDQIRRRDVHERAVETREAPRPPAPSPLEDLLGREALDRYEAALERLSASDREAVIARIELHCEYDEIAETLGSASGHAARMKVKRALVKLAKEMGRES